MIFNGERKILRKLVKLFDLQRKLMKCLINHVLNIQSFIDDPDSLRRKRQKFNNSPNALVLRHVQAEAEKREYFYKIVYNSTALPGVGLNDAIGIPASSKLFIVHCTILMRNCWLYVFIFQLIYILILLLFSTHIEQRMCNKLLQ